MEEESLLETADLRFLALCALLLGIALLVRGLLYLALRPWKAAPAAPYPLGRYDAAMLSGGYEYVIASAIAGLADAGAVTLHPGAVVEIRPTPLARERTDPVERQVLGLLPDHPNRYRMERAFKRTAVGHTLREKLRSLGIELPHRWRFVLARWFSRGLLLAAFAATLVVQWQELPMDKFSGLLFIELFLFIVPVGVCHTYLPLTRSRKGAKLASILLELETPDPPADPADHVASGVPRKLTEEGWTLEPGWVRTPAGQVALQGWDAYRDKWGQPFPMQFWELIPDNVSRTPEEHHRSSVRYRTLGVISGVLAIPCAFITFSGAFWAGPFFLFFSWAGARCTTRARKHRAADTRNPYRVPQAPGFPAPPPQAPGFPSPPPPRTPYSYTYSYRPGVLYLRSFAHHDAPLERTAPWQNIKTAILGSHTSYIEEIAWTLRRFGPAVAIGNPGAALPSLGPAQFFVPPDPCRERSDGTLERWQTEVLRLMDQSALVVIAAGLGEGLLWEFQQATARLPPHRLIVLIPLDREKYALFRQHAEFCFRRGLPADPRSSEGRQRSAHALIYFDDDWTPRFAKFADHPMVQLHRGRLATRFSARRYRNQFSHAAYPVFRANKVRWPGIELPVPFGRAGRQRILGGVSLGCAAVVLVLGGPILILLLSALLF